MFVDRAVVVKQLLFLVVLPLELPGRLIQVVILLDCPVIALILLLPHVLSGVFLQLFQLVGVGGSDELAVHVENLPLWVHEELTVVALDLDSPHYHVVLQVD